MSLFGKILSVFTRDTGPGLPSEPLSSPVASEHDFENFATTRVSTMSAQADAVNYWQEPSKVLAPLSVGRIKTDNFSAALFQESRYICLPSVLPMLTGDEDSRRFYQNHRLFRYQAAPEWIRESLHEIVTSANRVCTRARYDEAYRKNISIIEPDQPVSVDSLIGLVGLNSITSISQAREVLALAEGIRLRTRELGTLTKEMNYAATGFFSAGGDTLNGTYARRALRSCLDVMETAFIIDDLRAGLGKHVSLSDQQCLALCQGVRTPQQLNTSSSLSAVLQAARFHKEHPQIDSKRWLSFLENYLLQPRFEESVSIEFCEFFPDERPLPRVTPAECANDLAFEVDDSKVLLKVPGQRTVDIILPKTESPLMSLVRNSSSIDPNDVERIATFLANAIKARHTSYAQVYRALSSEQIPAQEFCSLLVEEQAERVKPIDAERLANSSVYALQSRGKVEFDQWLKDVQPEVCDKIVARLGTYIETGELKNIKKLTGYDHLFEFRFILPGGYRVFFTKLADSSIAIVGFGHHDVQRTKLPEFEARAVALQSNAKQPSENKVLKLWDITRYQKPVEDK